MWNGLANYFYGTTMAGLSGTDSQIEATADQLTLHTTNDDWILVDMPVSALKALCFETDEIDYDNEPSGDVQEVVEGLDCELTSTPSLLSECQSNKSVPPCRSVCIKVGGVSSPRYSPLRAGIRRAFLKQQSCIDRSRCTTVRANKAYEVQSGCKRQRRYNYIICNTSKRGVKNYGLQ